MPWWTVIYITLLAFLTIAGAKYDYAGELNIQDRLHSTSLRHPILDNNRGQT